LIDISELELALPDGGSIAESAPVHLTCGCAKALIGQHGTSILRKPYYIPRSPRRCVRR